jgi:transposase-like protein
MTKETVPAPASYVPSARSLQPGERRRFSEADKKRIVAEADRPGASVSGVARQYGIAARVLFRWKQELAPVAKTETTFLPVTITDAPEQSAETPPSSPPAPSYSPCRVHQEMLSARRHTPSLS